MRKTGLPSNLIQCLCVAAACALLFAACGAPGANEIYFGKPIPPRANVLRYITGNEPESLDPQVSTGQPEQRIYLALFEGLVEYDPQTLEPIPALAERWDAKDTADEFTFYLRHNARWSNGDPITARDVIYSIRRGLEPAFASRNAGQAYYILNAQPFNEGASFAHNLQTKEFIADEHGKRLTFPADEKDRAAFLKDKPELQTKLTGTEFVPVAATDIGVEAINDFTVRIRLEQAVPFFVKILPHNFFRVVPEKTITAYGNKWTRPENIVCSGAFKVAEWTPYQKLRVEKNPYYWDAANVRLDGITFYPVEDQTTAMNLYRAGEVDATYNRSVPRSWLEYVHTKKDYQDKPEAGVEFYVINTTQPPMTDARVRRAFALAIDKRLLIVQRPNARAVSTLISSEIFTTYPAPPPVEFNPAEARRLLAEAGYKDAAGNYDPSRFPVNEIAINFNQTEGNRFVAEVIQEQWRQNLSLAVSLKTQETATYLAYVSRLEYRGFARRGYAADYADPNTFLTLFATAGGDNGTGWSDPHYVELLNEANRTLDPAARNKLLAEAETLLLAEQPLIPLLTSSTNWLKKPYVKGMYANALTLHPWKFVYFERDEKKWNDEAAR